MGTLFSQFLDSFLDVFGDSFAYSSPASRILMGSLLIGTRLLGSGMEYAYVGCRSVTRVECKPTANGCYENGIGGTQDRKYLTLQCTQETTHSKHNTTDTLHQSKAYRFTHHPPYHTQLKHILLALNR